MGLLRTVPFGTATRFHMGLLAYKVRIQAVRLETGGAVPNAALEAVFTLNTIVSEIEEMDLMLFSFIFPSFSNS